MINCVISAVTRYICLFVAPIFITCSAFCANESNSATANAVTAQQNVGGHFELLDKEEKVFSTKSLRGNFALVYFGFTMCPDICPAALKTLKEATSTLLKYQVRVVPVFVALDVERDNATNISNFLSWDIAVGLHASNKAQLDEVAAKFKAYYAKTSDDKDYMINHTSFIYVMNREFEFLKHFPYNEDPNTIVKFILKYTR